MSEVNGHNKNQLPKGWTIHRLGDLCVKITNGSSAKQYDEKVGLPISRIETIWNGVIDWSRVKYVNEREEEFINKYALQDNDILFSHINSDNHLGKTAIFKSVNGKLIHGINLLLIRPDLNKINADFFNYQLKYLKYRGAFSSVAQKAVNQSSINQAKLKQFDIVVPPINHQQQVVFKIEELFSELDKSIEQLKTTQQQLKVYRQSVLKWAFEGRLTNENVRQEELPKHWKLANIKELIEDNKHALKAGPFGSSLKKEFYTKTGYKIYGQEQVISGDPFYGDYYISKEKFEELFTNRIKPRDVLISLVGTVGKVLILPDNCEEGIINPRLIKVSLNRNKYLPKFFKYYFESSTVRSFYSAKAQGTTMDVLNLGIIKTIPFPLCSIEEQVHVIDEIESRLSVVDKLEETITNSLQQAEALRQSILKKAFEGHLK